MNLLQQNDFSWISSGTTHVGTVREVNEDNYIERPELGLWVVADGMGGHSAGDIASTMVVDALSIIERTGTNEEFIQKIIDTLSITNQKLRQMAFSRFGKKSMVGSTVVVLVCFEGRYTILWAGDSRVYLYQKGLLEQVTRDHSHVNELVDSGALPQEEAEAHPLANVITRAIGAAQDLNIERLDGDLTSGDIFLLCSDGLNKELTDSEIQQFFKTENVVDINKALIHSALIRGAKDNITAISVKVDNEDETDDFTVPAQSLKATDAL
jgi:serine/threonine protein phosphatase PrpC